MGAGRADTATRTGDHGPMFTPRVTELVRQGQAAPLHVRQRKLVTASLIARPTVPATRADRQSNA
jgi:hypothetical protein